MAATTTGCWPAPGLVARSRVPRHASGRTLACRMDRDDIGDLFDYTEWANSRVCDAAAQLAAGELRAERGISHGSILGTLAHMAGAEWVWLERWYGRSHTGAETWSPWHPDRFPDVAALHARLRAIAQARRSLLATLSTADLREPRTFKRIDGSENTLPLIQQMLHMVNHATMHRGQVVGMLRQL